MQGNLNTHHWGKKRREGNIHFLQTHPSLTRPPVIRPRRTEFLFLEGLHEFHQVVQILLGEVARYPVLVLITGGVVYRLHEVLGTAIMEIRSTGVDVPQRGGVKLLYQIQPHYRHIVLLTIGVVALAYIFWLKTAPGVLRKPYLPTLPVPTSCVCPSLNNALASAGSPGWQLAHPTLASLNSFCPLFCASVSPPSAVLKGLPVNSRLLIYAISASNLSGLKFSLLNTNPGSLPHTLSRLLVAPTISSGCPVNPS